MKGGEISVKTVSFWRVCASVKCQLEIVSPYLPPTTNTPQDSFALGIVMCEILTGLHPMAKPLAELIEDALEGDELSTILDSKAEWNDSVLDSKKFASIALRCAAGRKMKRATVQEVLLELERLRNPNYVPTLAVGNTYYHPDTGQHLLPRRR